MDIPALKVISESGRFVIRDETATVYGVYDSEKAAEAALEDWRAYYAAPLVF